MMGGFFAGLDGGGTKTSVICRTPDGVLVGKKAFGPFNLNGIGESSFTLLVGEIVDYLKSLGQCDGVCIGASGVDNALLREIVSDMFSKAGIRLKLVSDYEIAHTGALGGREGIIAIAGTGSVCYGRTSDGKCARSGGWGHLIGDDGSAYGLGRDALKAVASYIDGCGESTALVRMLSDGLGLYDQKSIVSYVYSNDKRSVADLAPIVEKAAAKGDIVAIKIIEANASALVNDALAVSRRLGLDSCSLALLGGLFEHDTFFRRCFTRILDNFNANIKVVEPLHNAAEGALLEAGKLGC